MKIRGVVIEDTFAEAFTMRVARIIITGSSMRWVRAAALKLTGFATSVIGCKVEAGIERELSSVGNSGWSSRHQCAADDHEQGRPGKATHRANRSNCADLSYHCLLRRPA